MVFTRVAYCWAHAGTFLLTMAGRGSWACAESIPREAGRFAWNSLLFGHMFTDRSLSTDSMLAR